MRESFDLASDVCGAGLEQSGCHGRPHAGRDPILFTYPKTVRPEPVEGLPRFRQPFDKLRANGLYPNSIGSRPALDLATGTAMGQCGDTALRRPDAGRDPPYEFKTKASKPASGSGRLNK
jgi:hypothetical protein